MTTELFQEQALLKLQRFCLGLTYGNLGDAEDIAQEALTRVLQRLQTNSSEIAEDKFLPYLKKTAVNILLEQYRGKVSERTEQLDEATHGLIADCGISLVDEQERESFWRAVSTRLSPAQLEVIRLKYQAGMSFPEIAQRLGISARQVKYRHTTAIQRLRCLLKTR